MEIKTAAIVVSRAVYVVAVGAEPCLGIAVADPVGSNLDDYGQSLADTSVRIV